MGRCSGGSDPEEPEHWVLTRRSYPNRHQVSATPSWQPFHFIRDRSMVSLSWGKNHNEGDDKACKKSFIVAI